MNELNRSPEFQKILTDYKISDSSKKILEDVKLALLLAPTSAGRNTIMRELIKTGSFHYLISDTTRKPRINDNVQEQNGVEYWFRTEDEVLEDLKNGKFLEAEIIHGQQVSGISVRELNEAKTEGKIAITDVDLEGAKNVVSAKPHTTVFLIIPPTFEIWQQRLKRRGDMNTNEYKRRMETALKIFEEALKNNHLTLLVNDKVQQAADEIVKICQTGQPKNPTNNSPLIKSFYQKTKQLLDSY